jgi:predicted GNAT family acetyltransferase
VSQAEIAVADQPDASRYTITVDGAPAGRLDYQLEPGLISMYHAEIDPSMDGRGLGSRLVGYALDDARERGLGVLPRCPFVKHYIQRNPDYANLVPAARRDRFGL